MTKLILFAAIAILVYFFPAPILKIRGALHRIKKMHWWWIAAIIIAPLLFRLAMIGFWPIPVPLLPDEFVYQFAASLYASGRTHLPPTPDWKFFESIYVLNEPTIAPKYPPLQGLTQAVGIWLGNEPWFGVVLSVLAMGIAMSWFLIPWLGRRWTLFAAILVAGQLGLTTHWLNSYWGGAATCASAALLLGAWSRMRQKPTPLLGVLFAVGATALFASRPFEGGLLLAIPLTLHLVWTQGRKARGPMLALGLTGALGVALLGAYNASITGSAWKLPYLEYAKQNHYVPIFWFQPLQPPIISAKPAIRNTMRLEATRYHKLRSAEGIVVRANQLKETLETVAPLMVYVVAIPSVLPLLLRRRYQFLFLLLGLALIGSCLTVFHFSHYFAPAVPILVLFLMKGLERLGEVSTWGRPLCGACLLVVLYAEAQGVRAAVFHPAIPNPVWLRQTIERTLEERPRDHVIFVSDSTIVQNGRMTPDWTIPRRDWNQSRVIWVNDLGDDENTRFIQRWPDREYWRLSLPANPLKLEPLQPRYGQTPLSYRIN